MTDTPGILAINAGSSSIKFGVYGADLGPRLKGELEGIGTDPRLGVAGSSGDRLVTRRWPGETSLHVLLCDLLAWIEDQPEIARLGAIGHRVAIGGLEHSGPAVVTPEVLARLETLVPLAPLHQPRNLAPVKMLAQSHPHLPQVACFDTAFHRTLPPVAQLYGLPRAITDAGARRYGFHGLSYEYIAGRLKEIDPVAAAGRTIVAHLGSGASLCALRGGRSIATTMGFSPLSGLVMGTRPGDLDPGLVIWLMRERGMSVDEIESMLYHDAGLKGVSGLSNDMRDLLASFDSRAAEAVDLFVYKITIEIGALTAALGGLDALVFTAGIGEHAPEIRRRICTDCGWTGMRISEPANETGATRISTGDSAVTVLVVPTDEERMVARHTADLILKASGRGHPSETVLTPRSQRERGMTEETRHG
jgi:acetate kinase